MKKVTGGNLNACLKQAKKFDAKVFTKKMREELKGQIENE